MGKGTAEAYSGIQGWVDRPHNTSVQNNGNNMDVDMEMMEMKENGTKYQIYVDLYNKKSTMLKNAIEGN